MDQSSDGEYERREAEAEAESWSAGYHCTLPNSLAHFFLSHIHISLSLRLTENSPWLSSASGPAPFRRQLGHDWMIQPSTALQVRDDINPPPHTHTQTNLTKTTLFSIPPLCPSITIALACYSTMPHLLIFARKHQCCSLLCNHQTLLIERQTFKLLDDSCNGEGIS